MVSKYTKLLKISHRTKGEDVLSGLKAVSVHLSQCWDIYSPQNYTASGKSLPVAQESVWRLRTEA